MHRAIRIALTITLSLLVFAVVAPFAVQAAMPAIAAIVVAQRSAVDIDTVCGAAAVGRSRITGESVRMQTAGMRVDAQGYWTPCNRACGGSQQFVTWTVDGRRCTSAERLETSPTSRQRLQGSLHGDSETIRQRQGAMRGSVTYTCQDGTYTQTVATCGPAPAISGCAEPIDVVAGRCRFRYAKQGADGDQIAIRPRPGQGDMRAQCFGGVWMATSIYCAK